MNTEKLIRVKEKSEFNSNRLPIPVKLDATNMLVSLKKSHIDFSDLFNAYA